MNATRRKLMMGAAAAALLPAAAWAQQASLNMADVLASARFIFRNFVLNPLDAAASMLSYCGPADKRSGFITYLFQQQERWAFTQTPLDSLLTMARQAGFTQESFNACLQRRDLYDALIASKDKAAETFRINSTPTLIINGQVHRGALTLQELDRILQPLLGA